MAFAVRTGLEPVTSCVTGRHSNQAELTHHAKALFLIADAKVEFFFVSTKTIRLFFYFFLQQYRVTISIVFIEPLL